MKKIPLHNRQKEIIAYALVDDEDFERINHWKWQFTKNGYCRRTIRVQGKYKTLLLHRFILDVLDKKVWIDHINGDKLDNRKSNLRKCTPSENKYNIPVRSHNKSRYKGVEYVEKEKLYKVRIGVNGKIFCIGTFRNPIDAAKRYDEMAKIYHKEFTNLNFLS